jgi:hypothetical protein
VLDLIWILLLRGGGIGRLFLRIRLEVWRFLSAFVSSCLSGRNELVNLLGSLDLLRWLP